MVLCEKPLGRNAEEAEAMVDAVESAKVANMVGTTTAACQRSFCSSTD